MRTHPFYFYLIYYRNSDRPVAALAEKKDGKFTFLQMKTFIILRGNVSHARTKYIYFNDNLLVIQISMHTKYMYVCFSTIKLHFIIIRMECT